ALYRQAAERGDTNALLRMAVMREEAGDPKGAEVLNRQAADHGYGGKRARWAPEGRRVFRGLWPYGLDPDGTPTPRWL
ncbi:hypothetical protein ACFYQQ_39295, partial [Streptomyces sp. NPDC005496]